MAQNQTIKEKLSDFIRRYHAQQFALGAVFYLLEFAVIFLLINYIEYFFWLKSSARGVLFFVFWGWMVVGALWHLGRPLLSLWGRRKQLTQEQAAQIIGDHFPEIQDQLLNYLQLEQLYYESAVSEKSSSEIGTLNQNSNASNQNTSANRDLMLLAIQQKSDRLKGFSFIQALNPGAFKTHVLRLSAVLLLLFIWGLYDSRNISAASQRWFHFEKQFVQKAPFEFVWLNPVDHLTEGEDLSVLLTFKGKKIPSQAQLLVNGVAMDMAPSDSGVFSITVRQPNNDVKIQFVAAGFSDVERIVGVDQKPKWNNIQVTAVYPAYTRKKSEKLDPYQLSSVPKGTQLQFTFSTNHAQFLHYENSVVAIGSSAVLAQNTNAQNVLEGATASRTSTERTSPEKNGGNKSLGGTKSKRFNQLAVVNNRVKLNVKAMSNSELSAVLLAKNKRNQLTQLKDPFTTAIQIVEDEFPAIQLDYTHDSVNSNWHYFSGFASDDYAVSAVKFHYKIEGETVMNAVPLSLSKDGIFSYSVALEKMGIPEGKSLECYFSVTDNDGVSGPKTVQTERYRLKRKSELEALRDQNLAHKQVENQLQQFQNASQSLRKEAKKLQESMSKSNSVNFENRGKINEWIDKQEKQLDRLQKAIQKQEQLNKLGEEMKNVDPELKERREELKDRMDRLKDEKLEKLLDELRELMEKNPPKEQIQNKMNEINRVFQSEEKELESLMEQLKELRLEENIKEQAQKMDEWSKKEEQLAEKTQDLSNKEAAQKQAIQDALKKQQEELKSIEQKMEELQKQNKELENPMKLDMGENSVEGAKQENQEAQKKLDQNQKQNSAENQKKAAEKMKEAQQKMEESLEKSKEAQTAEDLQSLRALLENLIEVSHKQERIFSELNGLKSDNPRVLALNREQILVQELSLSIEDSLRALAKRQPMVSDRVTREISGINDHLNVALERLKVRDIGKAAMHEQYAMTGFNNLAVMLMESLKNVQQKMSQQKQSKNSKGNKSCSNPSQSGSGGKQKQSGKGSKLSDQQKQLGEKLQQMQQQGKGQKAGQGKPQSGEGQGQKQGEQGSGGSKGDSRKLSQELVELALKQEELRRMIQEMKKEALKNGNSGAAQKLQEAENMMEQLERDVVNKNITPQTMERQKQIMTRLLEHEKAQMQQGMEEQRESQNGQDKPVTVPPELLMETRKKLQERENLRRKPASLNEYYQQKVEEYLRTE